MKLFPFAVLAVTSLLATATRAFAQGGEPETPADDAQPEPPAAPAPQKAKPNAGEDLLPGERRVGIVVTANVNIPDHAASDLSKQLADTLTKTLFVRASAAHAVDIILADELPDDCIVNAVCIRQIGNSLAVPEILFVSMTKLGSQLTLDFSWADVATATAQPRPRIVSTGVEDRDSLFRDKAQELLPGVPLRPKQAATPSERRVVVEVRRDPVERQMTNTAWVATAVGSAAAVGAVVTGLLANDAYNELEEAGQMNQYDPDYDGDRSRLTALSITTDVLIGVAVVSAATAGTLYFLSNRRSQPKIDINPQLDAEARSAGISFGGSF